MLTKTSFRVLKTALMVSGTGLLAFVSACAYENGRQAMWGEYDYVAYACSHDEASRDICNPDDASLRGIGRTKSGGKR